MSYKSFRNDIIDSIGKRMDPEADIRILPTEDNEMLTIIPREKTDDPGEIFPVVSLPEFYSFCKSRHISADSAAGDLIIRIAELWETMPRKVQEKSNRLS